VDICADVFIQQARVNGPLIDQFAGDSHLLPIKGGKLTDLRIYIDIMINYEGMQARFQKQKLILTKLVS
jgi:hypothetical protein